MITFSKPNDKLRKLQEKTHKRVFSFNLSAGQTCPFAKDCHSKVVLINGKTKIQDSPGCVYRCYAASLEALYYNVYIGHKRNSQIVKLPKKEIVSLLLHHIPRKAQIIRLHTSGDFTSQKYFDAWLEVVRKRTDLIFYAYTKSLPYWIRRIKEIPENFILTASYGGRYDHLIREYNLRSALVVYSREEASQKNLLLEETEEIVSDPNKRNTNVAILLHGIQPAGTLIAKIAYKLKKEKTCSK